MGAMHEKTIEQLRETLRKKPRTFQAAWAKCGLTNYAKDRAATDEEVARIREYYAKRKTGAVRALRTPAITSAIRRPQTNTTDETKSEERTTAVQSADWLLDAINYLELAAAFTGFVLLFDWIGIAPALICCVFYLHSMAVMKRPNAWDSAVAAKTICFVIAIVFAWVHFQTFRFALDTYRPDVSAPLWVAGAGAVLLSGISLMALYQSRTIKTEQA